MSISRRGNIWCNPEERDKGDLCLCNSIISFSHLVFSCILRPEDVLQLRSQTSSQCLFHFRRIIYRSWIQMKLQMRNRRVRDLEDRTSYGTSTEQSYFDFHSQHQPFKNGFVKLRSLFHSSAHIVALPIDFTLIVCIAVAKGVYVQFKHQPHVCFEHGSTEDSSEYFAFDIP
jgi:hypothetical protein